MVEVHRRCFVFIVTFLKKLLEHSQENKMDAKVLGNDPVTIISYMIL